MYVPYHPLPQRNKKPTELSLWPLCPRAVKMVIGIFFYLTLNWFFNKYVNWFNYVQQKSGSLKESKTVTNIFSLNGNMIVPWSFVIVNSAKYLLILFVFLFVN